MDIKGFRGEIMMNIEEARRQLMEKTDEKVHYNRRAGGYQLRRWYKYQENINHLNDLELIDAKVLFSSLNELAEDEIQHLAAKYCIPKLVKNGVTVVIKDEEVAKQLGIDTKSYTKKRRQLERQISILIAKYGQQYEKEREAAILLIHGK